MKIHLTRCFHLLMVLLSLSVSICSLHAAEHIKLQLKWHHQFQFAGYYAAQLKGYYQEAGLDVQLVEGSVEKPPINEVLAGHVDYGIADSGLLLSRAQGNPVVALAAIFQHSPNVLLSLENHNIRYPWDLIGKRVMLTKDQGEVQFYAMLRKQKIDISKITVIPHTWQLKDLIEGKVDVISAYAMDEPIQLEKMGYQTSIISNQKYGVDFYGDVLFTSDRERNEHPERLEKFLQATKKGWTYAFSHRTEMAEIIAKMPGVAQRGIDEDLLQKEAALMEPYVFSDVVTLGHMDEERWMSIAQTFAALGVIKPEYNIQGFVYKGPKRAYLKGLVYGVIALLMMLAVTFLWNLQIRRQVIHRTRALQNEINRRMQAEDLLKIAGDVAQIGGWVMDVKTGLVNWSDEVAKIHEMPIGYSPSIDEGIQLFVPEYQELIKNALLRCLQDGTPYDLELEKFTASGKRIWVRTMGQAFRDTDGKIIRLQGSFQDISARKRLEAIKQGHARIQAMMVANLPQNEILKATVDLIEGQLPDAICAIFLLDKDGHRLRHAASIRLPESYLQAVDGVVFGQCGTIDFTQQRIILESFRMHLSSEECFHIALENGLEACWMASITSRSQHSLGAVALYRRQVYSPSDAEIELVESYAQLLGLVIERQQSDEHVALLQNGISRLNDIFMITEAPVNEPMLQKVVFLNEAFSKITGISTRQLMGESPFKIFVGETATDVLENLQTGLRNMQPVTAELLTKNQQGEPVCLELDALPLHDKSGWYSHWVMVMRDVTERKQAYFQIRQLAYYDTMTGLPNRLLLHEKLAEHLANTIRTKTTGALLFIDLDNFKTLNDTHGHDVGDALLIEVAKRIKQSVRRIDTVSRLGGDEFVVVLDNLSRDANLAGQQAENICEKILAAFKKPFNLKHYQHYTTPSIGVVMFDFEQPSHVEELLRRADMAMYQAKEAGRNGFRFFDTLMETELKERVALEADLHLAIEQEQFLLHFQPQYNQHNQIVGVEALIRWQHPEKGLIMPGKFIEVAEGSGQIVDIGRWVIEQACQLLGQWEHDPRYRSLLLSINVSPQQYLQPGFVDEVVSLVQQSGIDPTRLKFELTESMLVDNVEDIIIKMNALRRIGLSFSLDDFGTGYSSLSYLKRLPFDQLKIDQSFVRDMLHGRDHESIVNAIISLGRSLELEILAEGVETEAQLQLLYELGCEIFQGYYFTKPLPLNEFEQLVTKHATKYSRQKISNQVF